MLCAYGDFINLEDGQQLIEECENQDCFYVLISGVLQVHADRDGHYTPIADMGPGDSIGEINLFDPGKASASVIAHSRARIWKVTRYNFETLIQSNSELGEHLLIALVSILSRRIRNLNGKFLTVEKFVKCKKNQHSESEQYHPQGLLEDIFEENRDLLKRYGNLVTINSGYSLIKEGEKQDSFYLVIYGVLQVHANRNGHDTPIAYMGPGDSIGEINLFDPGEASASVTAQSRAQIWQASRHDFETLIQNHPQLGERLLIALVSQLSRRIRNLNEHVLSAERITGWLKTTRIQKRDLDRGSVQAYPSKSGGVLVQVIENGKVVHRFRSNEIISAGTQ